MYILDTPIEYLKGIGPSRANLFKKELNIFTYGDLLHHYPFRYIDKSSIHSIASLTDGMPFIQLKGKIIKFQEKGHKKSRRLVADFQDETGLIELVWFKGIRWIKSALKLNTYYIVFGKPSLYKGLFNIAHPEIDVIEDKKEFTSGLQPVYHSTDLLNAKGLNSRVIAKLTKVLLSFLVNQLEETLSANLISKLNLPSRETSLFDVHHPKDSRSLVRAQKRLKFEEFFFLQLHLLKLKLTRTKKSKGYAFENLGDNFNNFYKNYLPFDLTNAQKRVLKEIRNDVRNPQQMNRLLQGDVGSGKTLVALLSMLMAVDNNYQACLMVPTEILAQQHFRSISKYLAKMDIEVAVLTGSTKAKERKLLHHRLEQANIDLLIGTHALLEDKVVFNNLGLVIIDEQHRFGVYQRMVFNHKNHKPNILVMSATPIPRTLTLAAYGDMKESKLIEKPLGRKPIITSSLSLKKENQLIDRIKEKIKNSSSKFYWVCPLIEESEELDLKAAEERYKILKKYFKNKVLLMHGRLSEIEKEEIMTKFKNKFL